MRISALIKTTDDPVYRYRLRAFEPELERRGWQISLHCLPRKWIARFPLYFKLPTADVVLLQRRLLGPLEIWALRRFARRLVFDFDDAIMYRSFNSPKGPYSRKRKARFAAMLRSADAVIAGNSFLTGLAGEYADGAKIYRIPTCVDAARYPIARHENSRDGIQLVWIGSASTVRSLGGISEHLKAAARAAPGIRLKLICDVFPESLPLPFERCLWSAEREAAELAAAGVGIGWMPDSPWSRGKCGLKILQYMAAGLPVIANPVGVHCDMIVHGKNGFLVETPEEWVEALRSLASDPELRRTMGRAGRNIAVESYSPARWAEVFVEVVSGEARS